MSSMLIRYRYAALLLWATMAMVANPILHSIRNDHVEHITEHVNDTHWSTQDLCPYCDAVSLGVEGQMTFSGPIHLPRLGTISAIGNSRISYSWCLAIRLRAPPVVA